MENNKREVVEKEIRVDPYGSALAVLLVIDRIRQTGEKFSFPSVGVSVGLEDLEEPAEGEGS